jgi:hypothetical protein
MKQLTITHFTNDDGEALVSVPLTNTNKNVTLHEADFNSLIEKGLNPCWRLVNGQVFECGRTQLSIARLVANVGKGEKVHLLDSDPCHLSRNNIVIGMGGSGKSNPKDKLLGKGPHVNNNFKIKLLHEFIDPTYMKEITNEENI